MPLRPATERSVSHRLRKYIAAAGFNIETAGDLDAALGAGSPHSVDEPFPICMTMNATGW
jgi:hypothetical protein